MLLGSVPLELRGAEISLTRFTEGLAANSKDILVKQVHKHGGSFLNEKYLQIFLLLLPIKPVIFMETKKCAILLPLS